MPLVCDRGRCCARRISAVSHGTSTMSRSATHEGPVQIPGIILALLLFVAVTTAEHARLLSTSAPRANPRDKGAESVLQDQTHA